MTDEQRRLKSVEGLSQTSRDHWVSMYCEYSERVWDYVATLIGSDQFAVGDAVQETFLSAARGFKQFDADRGTIWSWLTGIAHRQVALYWRRQRRELIASDTRLPEPLDSSSLEPSFQLQRDETVAQVRQILSEMSAESAALLIGKYNDGLSVAQLMEQWGGTFEGVRSKLARARSDFQRRYETFNWSAERPVSGLPVREADGST